MIDQVQSSFFENASAINPGEVFMVNHGQTDFRKYFEFVMISLSTAIDKTKQRIHGKLVLYHANIKYIPMNGVWYHYLKFGFPLKARKNLLNARKHLHFVHTSNIQGLSKRCYREHCCNAEQPHRYAVAFIIIKKLSNNLSITSIDTAFQHLLTFFVLHNDTKAKSCSCHE